MGLEAVSRTEEFLKAIVAFEFLPFLTNATPKLAGSLFRSAGLHSGSLPERQIHCHFWKQRVNPRVELAITKIAELARLRYATRGQFAFHYVSTQSV